MSNVSTLSYTYDDAGHLTSETEQIVPNEEAMSFLYSYDLDGRRSSMSEPSGGAVTYHYSGRSQMTQIDDDVPGSGNLGHLPPPLAYYTYDLNGNRLSRSLAGPGSETSYSYDDANRLLAIDNQASDGTSFAKLDYSCNSVGNRTSRSSTIDVQQSTDVYDYDAIDQLRGVKYNFNASNNTQDRTVSYNYDAVGNRSGANGVSDSANGSTSYTANNLNQYTAVGSDAPQYDDNGNLVAASVSGTSWAYTYDAQNRLVHASAWGIAWDLAWDFAYGARNRCVSRTRTQAGWGLPFVNTTYFYYDGWNLVEEQDSDNGLIARYIHGAQVDELLRRSTEDGDVYYHQDALGSTIALTDDGGNVMERYTYDVFGTPTFEDDGNPTDPSDNRFLFTGREYIQELGLYDYRNRVYSPITGRFLQTDSLGFRANDVNIYRYVANSPVGNTDALGLGWACIDFSDSEEG